MKKKVQKKREILKINRASEVPASQGQLEAVRSELKSDILSLGLKIDGNGKRIDSVDSRMNSLDSRMDSLDSRMDSLDSRMDSLDSRMESFESRMDSLDAKIDGVRLELKGDIAAVRSDVQRVIALVEEQNARNNWVIDAYKVVVDVQEDLRARTGRLETKVFGVEGKS